MDHFLTIAAKRDARDYDAAEVTDAELDRVLQAGRMAGSARNRQRRRFVVLRTDAARARAAEGVTRPDNLRRCAVAVAIVAGEDDWALFDAGRAAQNMMIAGQGDGLVSCPNAVADRALLDELVGVGEDERLITLLSFGHRPAGWRTPEDRSAGEWLAGADRASLDELVHAI